MPRNEVKQFNRFKNHLNFTDCTQTSQFLSIASLVKIPSKILLKVNFNANFTDFKCCQDCFYLGKSTSQSNSDEWGLYHRFEPILSSMLSKSGIAFWPYEACRVVYSIPSTPSDGFFQIPITDLEHFYQI